MAGKTVSPDAISTILSNPSPDSSNPNLPEIIVQVLDLSRIGSGKAFRFTASDGIMKLKALLQSTFMPDVEAGKIQNFGLLRIIDYALNDIKSEKFLMVSKLEVVSPALDGEIKNGVVEGVKEEKCDDGIVLKKLKMDESIDNNGGIVLKPKQEFVSKSAAQIVHEQHHNAAPAARMAMTRRVLPLVSLNPYQGNWTIKVRVTSKGSMRTYKNARGEGCVFNVELTDQDGTQIQATMFNEAAKKFFDKFELGKVYYISKGTLRVANKQFKTVENNYEMTLNENSIVEEASNEEVFVPEIKFNFIPIDQLGPYVNGKELVDIIGVVQNVSPTMSIRRKSDNETIHKRDITVADESKKTVVVSLWNELATGIGQELLDIADTSPIVAIKSLKVGDFQGLSLSTVSKSSVKINPDLPEANKLRSWYDSEGKETTMVAIGSGMSPSPNGARSMFSDRVSLSHIIANPSLGDGKPVFFNIRAYISFIKPDQTLWYRACKTCNKKVTEAMGSGYWCEGCQKNDEECSLRYILMAKVSDASGEAWVSAFNQEAEKILGLPAEDLDKLRSEEGDEYQMTLKQVTWVPHLFRVSVAQNEYNNEKRQRVTVRSVAPVDYAAETKFLLDDISKMKDSQ
ncbi:hypothetical protein ACFE04_009116 [Oxalis oulophora]